MVKYSKRFFFGGGLFVCCLSVDFHLRSLRTSFQMWAQLSFWDFLSYHVACPICLTFRLHPCFLGTFPECMLFLKVILHFFGEHFPVGLSAKVNGKQILKAQMSENIIRFMLLINALSVQSAGLKVIFLQEKYYFISFISWMKSPV